MFQTIWNSKRFLCDAKFDVNHRCSIKITNRAILSDLKMFLYHKAKIDVNHKNAIKQQIVQY